MGKTINKEIAVVKKDIQLASVNFAYQPNHTSKKFKFPTTKRVAKQFAKFLKKESLIERNQEL